jgi:hypothetical protein
MHRTRAEPAATRGAAGAPAAPAHLALGHGVRLLVLAAGSAAVLVAVTLIAYALALAHVPQHRAALEELIHSQTGLEVRFSELGLRWVGTVRKPCSVRWSSPSPAPRACCCVRRP